MSQMLSYRTFKDLYSFLASNAKEVSPRGMKVKEVENFSWTFPPYVRFVGFKARKLSVDYLRREFLWYLNADRSDLSICDHASIWKQCVNSHGEINSNYGHYIFGSGGGFQWVIRELTLDKDSRRASAPILAKEHLVCDVVDYPCTYALNFRIRDNSLNMSVHMRSQDVVYGMGSDLPIFSFIQEMVMVQLRDWVYPDLVLGNLHMAVDSFHVYERHYEMLKNILKEPEEDFSIPGCPLITDAAEVSTLLRLKTTDAGLRLGDPHSFLRWSTTIDKC